MKNKILTLVIITAVIIPQIASAAWWNPFSWSIFHGTDSKNQALENRIHELERKLESATTTTPLVKTLTDSTPTTSPKKTEVSTKPTVQVVKPKTENFATVKAEAYRGEAKSYLDMSNYIDEVIKYIDLGLNAITKTRDQSQAYGTRHNGNTELADALIDLYNNDILLRTEYKNWFIRAKNVSTNNESLYLNEANESLKKVATRDEAVSAIQEIQNSTVWKTVMDQVTTELNEYKQYKDDKDNQYEEIFAAWEDSIGSNSTSYSPIYSQPLPTAIQIPRVRHTSCNVYGNNISCESYSGF